MRRSLAILLAAATAVTASAATSSLSQAAPLPAPAVTTGDSGIEQVRERSRHGGRRHGGHRRHGHRGHGGHHGGHHYGHHGGFGSFGVFPGLAFGFGFPQAYYAPRYYQPYSGYADCFRTWDGQLICR